MTTCLPTPPAAWRTRIKMCGFTREQDVAAAVSAGADAIGFVLYANSPRYVTYERAAELAQQLPPFVTPVLLFVNEDEAKVKAACAALPGALIQFHGDESAHYCRLISASTNRPYLRAARIAPQAKHFDLAKFAQHYALAQAILLDAQVDGFGGGGQTFDWSILPDQIDAHLILSGGLNASNVASAIQLLRPRCKTLALDVSSGIEVPAQKGIKDAQRMRQFVAAVRQIDDFLYQQAMSSTQDSNREAFAATATQPKAS